MSGVQSHLHDRLQVDSEKVGVMLDIIPVRQKNTSLIGIMPEKCAERRNLREGMINGHLRANQWMF